MADGARALVVILDLFVALSAIGGGFALATGMERGRFSTDILRRTPFQGFVWPGVILAVVVGGSAAVATALTMRSASAGGVASAVAGVLLAGFIAIEVWVLADEERWSVTEAVYFVIGLAMIGLGLVAWLAS
jgi:hypothetical protein